MVTLSKRASPSQARILRIIEGAVLNTADAHGEPRDVISARSIAKRATGTLTAQWPEVLAANSRPPEKGSATWVGRCRACERRAHLALQRTRAERVLINGGSHKRRASQLLRRSPLLVLWVEIKRDMWKLKRTDPAKAQTMIEVLSQIDALRQRIARAEIETIS